MPAKPLGLPGIPWNAGVLALPRRFDEFRSGKILDNFVGTDTLRHTVPAAELE
jgi:hypothetical protein